MAGERGAHPPISLSRGMKALVGQGALLPASLQPAWGPGELLALRVLLFLVSHKQMPCPKLCRTPRRFGEASGAG